MRFRFRYTGVRVQDVEKAIEFYVNGLGMREARRLTFPETEGGVVVNLESEGSAQALELNWYPPGTKYDTPYTSGEDLDHLAFDVEGGSLEEAIRHLEQHGGRLTIPPFKERWARLAFVESPDGHAVELIERVSDES